MKRGRILVIVLAVAIVTAFMPSNQAQGRGRSTTFTGPRGRTCNRSVQRGMTSDGYQRTVNTTGPGGNNISHSTTTTISK